MAQYYDDPVALAGREQTRDWWNTGTGGSGSANSFASSSARSNVAALPDIAQITQLINSINQTAQQASNAGRIPNGRGLESISSGIIGQALGGQLPQDVINLIGQQAAERGVMTGSPMGPGSNASFLRSLGRTSLDMMGTGQNWLSAANARNPGAPLFDPSSMFITPSQYGSLEMERLRLPRSGGSSGSVGGFPMTAGTSTGGMGTGVNWEDLFGGNRGLTYATPMNDFPYGIGTGTSASPMYVDNSGYTPNIPFGSSFGGQGLYEDAFAGL